MSLPAAADGPRPGATHPAHAFFLAATVPPFLGVVMSDVAYRNSHEIQWSNFSSWLIAGGLVFGGIALACALAGWLRGEHRDPRAGLEVLLLLATWVLGLFNAFVHARDAWAVMPTGFVLSVIVGVLACAAAWLGFAGLRAGGAP